MSELIQVAIVDDHAIIRQGLRTLLTNMGMHVVGEARTGSEAIQLAQEHRPDVMLLDIRMKGDDGIAALPQIKAASPQTAVIMLTTYANPTYFSEAVRNGASGYLLKESEPEDIVQAIQTAASRRYLFDPDLLNMVVGQQATSNATPPENSVSMSMASPCEPELVEPLSDREKDVLRLLAQGLSNAGIAESLQVSITTVKTHVSHILRKLDVSDRTQAALIASRFHLDH